jgi:hypothetical protein
MKAYQDNMNEIMYKVPHRGIPGLLKTDRAIIYLRQRLDLILREVQARTTKTIGDTYYRISRLRQELFPILRMSGEHTITEKILELGRNLSTRTPRQLAISSIKAFQTFLESYNQEAELEDEEMEAMREKLEQLEQQLADKEDEPSSKVEVIDATDSVFVIMPFNKDFNDVWKGAVEKATKNEGFRPVRVDTINKSSNITDDIIESIRKCKIAVVDVSSNNPNVMFELGYAVAIGKPNIIISQSVEFLPFDIRNIRTILYLNSWSGIEELRAKIQEFLKEYKLKLHEKPVKKVARKRKR